MPAGLQQLLIVEGSVPCEAPYATAGTMDSAFTLADFSGSSLGTGQLVSSDTVAFFGDLDGDTTIGPSDVAISKTVSGGTTSRLSAYPGATDIHPLTDFNGDGAFTSADTAILDAYLANGSAPADPRHPRREPLRRRHAQIISIPNFMAGPDQQVNVPAGIGVGIPVTLSLAYQVHILHFRDALQLEKTWSS